MTCSDLKPITAILVAAALTACTTSPRFTGRGERTGTERPPQVPASSPLRPSSERSLLTLEGLASFYAHEFHGRKTSNGETYNMYDLTAAHRTFPFGTQIRVTNLENGKIILVRVNDRGPFHEGRIIDLSLGAARALDFEKTGTANVRLEVMAWGDGR